MQKTIILFLLVFVFYEGNTQSIFLPKNERIRLLETLEKKIIYLNTQPQGFARDTALFRTLQTIYVHATQLNHNLIKIKRTHPVMIDSLDKIANRINWLEGKADVLKWKATSYLNNNEPKAIRYFSDAYGLYQKTGNTNQQAWCLINQAVCLIYREGRTHNEWNKAKSLMFKALQIGITTNDLEIIHQAYNYLGDAHIFNKQYAKALEFYENEIPYFEKYGAGKELVYLEGRRTNYAYLSICHMHLNNEVKANQYLHEFLEVNNPDEGAYANYLYHTVLGETSSYYLQEKKDYRKALKYRLLYEDILDERRLFEVANHYYEMFKIYKNLNKPVEALAYHEKWALARDSLKTEELSREFKKIEIQFNVERKELQIKNLQNATLVKENEKQQAVRNFLILTSMLGFGLVLIVVGYNRSRRNNTILKLNLSLVQQELTAKILHTQEIERQRIASDLHDDLGGTIATIKRHVTEINEKNKQDDLKSILEEILPMIQQTSDDIRRISHNLMPPDFGRIGLKNSIEYLTNRTFAYKTKIEFVTFGQEHRFTDEIAINIYRIVSELINNLLKHAEATLATVQMVYYNEYVSIIVEDNGIGDQSAGRITQGIGLKNIHLRAEYIGATLMADSGPNGSTYILEVPYSPKLSR